MRENYYCLPAVVYRMRDGEGRLLYIGCTTNLARRLRGHRSTKPWFADIAELTIDPYPTQGEAYSAEQAAIRAEHPLYNADPQESALRGHVTRKETQRRLHAQGRVCNDSRCRSCRAVWIAERRAQREAVAS